MIVVNGRKEEVIMTRKERLFADYEAVKDKAICVTLMVRMPGGEIEVISNSNVEIRWPISIGLMMMIWCMRTV